VNTYIQLEVMQCGHMLVLTDGWKDGWTDGYIQYLRWS